jgi:hypothetical protein
MRNRGSGATLKSNPQGSLWKWRYWSRRKKIFIILTALVAIVALAVGLGVGLTRGGKEGEEAPGPTTPGGNVTGAAIWQPKVGTSWQIEILSPLTDTSLDVDVYDIDLFYTQPSLISQLHDQGRRVICYFSAGSYEDWRPDIAKFKDTDLGKTLAGWPNEKWLDLRSTNVRNIMLSRLDMARNKGCDGVDPDNVDGYDNDNGLGLTQDDSVNFVNFLADAAHSRNVSLGLKNAGDIIPRVINQMQWSVNEQCVQYDECSIYRAFIDAGKPVFHIEYPKGDNVNNSVAVPTSAKNEACGDSVTDGFSTIIKNMNLDDWIETCR